MFIFLNSLFFKSIYFFVKFYEGTCVCSANYDAYDCSINLSDKPLLLNTTYTNNLFDISNQTLTDILLVVSKFLASSETATLKCDIIVRDSENIPI